LLDASPQEIEDVYKRALRIAHKEDDMELSVYVLLGMASHSFKVEDADSAEHLFLQALTLAQRTCSRTEEGLAEGKLAMCLASTAQGHATSLPHFRKAIALQKGSTTRKAGLHLSLASTLRANGQIKEAHVEYKRALDMACELGNCSVEIAALTDLADLYEGDLADSNGARQCRERLKALKA